jgi:hypothetical protein
MVGASKNPSFNAQISRKDQVSNMKEDSPHALNFDPSLILGRWDLDFVESSWTHP